VVIPSVCEENAPFSAAEALAHGRPIIVSRIGGLPELAAEGRGFLCEPGDALAFAERIHRLTTDLQLCRDMGAKARRFAQEELSRAAHVQRLESLYSALI
jgi:glycosyltransferase involved in cell wall biosynthesis